MYNSDSERLRDRIKKDLSGNGYWANIREDYSELYDYFLNSEEKERLKFMKPFKKFFVLNWWLLKAMLLRLTPVRRILFLIGFILSVFTNSIRINGTENNSSVLGALIIIFVLMLELKDKLLAKSELGEGRQVQQALMPNAKPEVNGWEIWLFNLPANDVGGDLVDFIHRKNNTYLLTVGDVSGKGLGAALFSIKLQSSIRTLAREDFSIEDIFYRVNDLFYKDGIHNRFASMISLELNENSNNITFVNAGHMPPVIIKPQGAQEFLKGNIAIGLTDKPEFEIKNIELDKGETLVLYSDGVVEETNRAGVFYGKERMLKLLDKYKNESAEKLGIKLIKDLEFFRYNHKLHDDISIAIIKRTA